MDNAGDRQSCSGGGFLTLNNVTRQSSAQKTVSDTYVLPFAFRVDNVISPALANDRQLMIAYPFQRQTESHCSQTSHSSLGSPDLVTTYVERPLNRYIGLVAAQSSLIRALNIGEIV